MARSPLLAANGCSVTQPSHFHLKQDQFFGEHQATVAGAGLDLQQQVSGRIEFSILACLGHSVPENCFFCNPALDGEEVKQSVGVLRPSLSVLILCSKMLNVCYYHHSRVAPEP